MSFGYYVAMELRDLRYFVMLADERHFTRAAAALGISQPGLSRQILKLESELGAELFHRTKRSVLLTPAGRAVLGEARSLLKQAKTTFEVARQAAGGERGDLRIGFIEIAAFAVLSRVVAAHRRAHPGVAVHLTELTTLEQVVALREHTIDVGIMRAPIPGDDIESVPVSRESVAVVLPSRHRLAKRASIRLDSLRKEPFIFHSNEKATRLSEEIAALARQRGFVPQVSQQAGEFHTICSLVAAGLGISVVPHSAQAIKIPGITFRKLVDPEVSIEYCVGWLKDTRSPCVKAFRALYVR
jgi:DNA-binding transcriptional LysR family regulator